MSDKKTQEQALSDASAKWTAKYNALPSATRRIGTKMQAMTRMQHLNFEKARLKERYEQSMEEINHHLMNCEIWLLDERAPHD